MNLEEELKELEGIKGEKNNSDLNEIMSNYSKEQIIRVKGIGQLDDESLRETMFSVQKRFLEPIEFEDEGVEMLQELMGKDVEPRKEFVFNNIDFGGIKIG